MFSPQSRLRHAVADTFAMVIYCSVVNMLIEIFSPLSNPSRHAWWPFPVNIMIAWPYGLIPCSDALARRSPVGWVKNGGRAGLP